MFKHKYFILSVLLPLTGGLIFSPLGLWTLLMVLCLWPFLAYHINQSERQCQMVAESQSAQSAFAKEKLLDFSQANERRELIGISRSIVQCFLTIPWLLCWLVIGVWFMEPSLFLERITLIYNEISDPDKYHLMFFAMSALSTSGGTILWVLDSYTLKKLSLSKNQNISNED